MENQLICVQLPRLSHLRGLLLQNILFSAKCVCTLLIVFAQISCSSKSKNQHQCIGTFYGYGKPTSGNIGGMQVDVGPSLYELEFNSDRHDGNWVKLVLQELEVSKEKGGSWSRPIIGTTITSEFYTDHYAEPITMYGDYNTSEKTDSLIITGEMNQGEHLNPIPFRIALVKEELKFINNYFLVTDSVETCFELSIEPRKPVKYCSNKKYFITEMINQYEKEFKKKMSDKRRKELMEINGVVTI